MRSHYRTDQIECGVDVGCPVTHCLVDGILQRTCAVVHAVHLSAQQFHPVYIQTLAAHIFLAHIDLALHVKQCAGSCSCHAVLTSAGFGDNPLFAHFLCQQNLSQHVVDLVCAGVVQIFPLQIDLAAAQIFCHPVCVVQHRRSAGIVPEQCPVFF